MQLNNKVLLLYRFPYRLKMNKQTKKTQANEKNPPPPPLKKEKIQKTPQTPASRLHFLILFFHTVVQKRYKVIGGHRKQWANIEFEIIFIRKEDSILDPFLIKIQLIAIDIIRKYQNGPSHK